MKRIAIAVALLLTLAAPAWGQDFEKGQNAYERGDYPSALSEWRPLADQGHANAQFNLGVSYWNGRGVPQDDAEAVTWYRKAADQGHADAQFNLGWMFANGKGVPQDYVQALMWLNLAAEQGSKYAIKNRDILAKSMTPAKIAEAQKLAREWKPKKE